MDDLAQRIAAIEDRQAVTDLVHLHAEHARSGTLHQIAHLFLPDASYEISHFDPARPGEIGLIQRIEGVENILGGKVEVAGPSANLWPMIHNLRIELDGDEASSVCVSHTVIWPQGLDAIGEYRDTFRKVDGIWRFATRNIVVFGRSDGAYAIQAYDEFNASKH